MNHQIMVIFWKESGCRGKCLPNRKILTEYKLKNCKLRLKLEDFFLNTERIYKNKDYSFKYCKSNFYSLFQLEQSCVWNNNDKKMKFQNSVRIWWKEMWNTMKPWINFIKFLQFTAILIGFGKTRKQNFWTNFKNSGRICKMKTFYLKHHKIPTSFILKLSKQNCIWKNRKS